MTDLTAYAGLAVPGTRSVRHYIIDCSHGTTQLDLNDVTKADDARVLAKLLPDHRSAILETEREECDCEPTALQLGRAAVLLP